MRRLLLAALLAAAAAPAAAQERVIVRTEAGTPVVAAEVLLAVGSQDEPEDLAGIAYLTARAAVAPVRPVLDSLGARLTVDAGRDAVSLRLTAAPDAWEEATRRLLVALFRDPVDSVATVRQRTALVQELAAREVSPADALAREVEEATFGAGHPWGRPSVGTARSVRRLRVEDADGFLRRHFVPERAVVVVVGPVAPEEAREALASFLEPGALRRTPPPEADPARAPVRTHYDAITAWVSAVYPFGPDADVEALEMLARLALREVSFGVRRPQVYNARVDVQRHAGGGALRLHLVVPPREADRWAAAMQDAVRRYAAEPLPEIVFADALRRHRGERLLVLDAPEARAAALAREALLGRPPRLPDPEGLTPARLHAAARALGRPVLVFLGPFETDDDAGGASR